MPTSRTERQSLSRRDVLIGASAALSAATTSARVARANTNPALENVAPPGAEKHTNPTPSRRASRFDIQHFIEDCRHTASTTSKADKQRALQDLLARAMSDPSAVLAGIGEPTKGGIQTLHRSADLTILNIIWSPLMQLFPHEHRMWSLIGLYTGREDNIFWERNDTHLSAVRAAAVMPGSVVPLPLDVIHSVSNPIGKLTGAIHIYGGDFFATPRSEWDPETLTERDWDIQRAVQTFKESTDRFFSPKAADACGR